MMQRKIIFIIVILFRILTIQAQERPFIWVTQSEREDILEKIDKQPWAASLYNSFLQRLDVEFSQHQKDPHAFLMGMMLNVEAATPGMSPPLKVVDYKNRYSRDGRKMAKLHMRYLQVAIDCGMVYYLTQEEKYAQCALDILNAFVVGLNQLSLDENTSIGGWLYTGGQHLREAREIGAQVPMIYDFVSPFIKKGGKPYDLGSQAKVEFPHEEAQNVFRTYVKLAIERGHIGSNWSVLESPSMVQNLLALEDEKERIEFLKIYLTEGSDKQDPLAVIANNFQKEGDVYPETSQYSSGVASLTTYLLTILTKYDPSLQLGKKYENIPMALSRWEDMKYPNDEIVVFGDGHRYGGTDYTDCEAAYYLGEIEGIKKLIDKNGRLINTAIMAGDYERGQLGDRPLDQHSYFEPLSLLWFLDDIEGNIELIEQPRTDNLRHASLFLQRNLSETKKPEDGLMCFVGGAHMVHGHANGMDMELYGKGYVLGVDHGRGRYQTELHENYSRLFAAHNTVIVNGSSRSKGGWVNLGINPVQLVGMEPMLNKEAVSPYHSFTQTSFVDDKGDLAEAVQQRTMALIRTSPTTGYYVDVFRSKSEMRDEYHDYLYHNIGDQVEYLNEDIQLNSTPERYMENAHNPWVQNRQYRHPGWHYFEDVHSSSTYSKDVKARFSAEKLGKEPIYMNMYIPGEENREYTKVKAPQTFEAPKPYWNKPTPTIVIRKEGEAWEKPFVVVYEPYKGSIENSSIQSVEKIQQEGIYKGLKVTSNTGTQTLVQYIITQEKKKVLKDKKLGLTFSGTFAIITTDANGNALNIYMGEGTKLKYKNVSIEAKDQALGAYLDLSVDPPVFKCNVKGDVTFSID